MYEYSPLLQLTEVELLKLGVNSAILKKFTQLKVPTTNLFYNQNDWAFPVVYFDSSSHFEFRFTVFQHDWSDDSQLNRFSEALKSHVQSNTKLS